MEPHSPARVCCAEHQRDAHRTGQLMTQAFKENRRQSTRRTGQPNGVWSLLLGSAIFSTQASAQMLGYAAAPQSGFPSDNIMLAPPASALSDEGEGRGL